MKKSEPEFIPESILHKREKLNEKTRLLDPHRKMSSGTGYTELLDDSIKVNKQTVRKCCSCQGIISALCSCNFWYHVLMFILFPWAIYHYRIQIVNCFYDCWYGELPEKAMESNLGPPVKRLRNLGNTCFFNSMNQSINQTVLLQQMLINCSAQARKYAIKPEQQEQLVVEVVGNTEHADLTNEAHDLYCSQIAMPLWHVVVPRGLLRELSNRNPRFGRRKEEDSHEALRCLLDGLRMEEINKIKDQVYSRFGVTKDPASQADLDGEEKLKLKMYLREAAKQCVSADTVFGGVQVSTTICRECYTALQNEEKFLDMSLPLPEDKAETVGASGYRPPVINDHDKHDVKGSSLNGKEPPHGESDKDAESANDTVHDKQPVNQNETKEPLEDLQPDQAYDSEVIDDRDNKLLISIVESDHDSGSEDKPDKKDTLDVEVHHPVDDEHNAPKGDGEAAVDEHEDGESAVTARPTSQLQGEEHDNQITGVDEVNRQPDVDANSETVPAEEKPSGSEDKPDKKDTLDIEVHHPVDDEYNAPKGDVEAVVDEHEDGVTVHPTSQLEGEEHDNQITGVDEVNKQPDVDVNSETVPAEEKPSEDVHSQEKINNQDVIDVNLSNDDHQKPQPDVALSKAKLHKYLENKGLQFQMLPPESEEEKDPQTLEAILNEYTALDILDKDNRFICKTCTDNHTKSMDNSDGDDDNPPLSLVSKQIAVHQLPPVLILHLKRFSIEPDGIFKDTQHIKFPFKLNMAPYCTAQCIEEMGDRNQEIWYGLYAVVVHDGNTLEHGHYFAYVRRRRPTKSSSKSHGAGWVYDQAAAEGGYWFYASDLTIRLCEQGFEEVRRQKAYMLFYECLPKKTVVNSLLQ